MKHVLVIAALVTAAGSSAALKNEPVGYPEGYRFKGDSRTERLVTDAGAGCFACHASQKDRDYVFGAMRP